MNNPLLTAKQAQELLKVDRTTIYRMLKDGRINGVKVGNQWRFFESDINAMLGGKKHAILEVNQLINENKILPLTCVQSVQDVFAEIAEVGAVTANPNGIPLTRISNSCDFCKLILGTDEGRQGCINSWKKLAEQKEKNPEFTNCHAGLMYARSGIKVNHTLAAILIAGQFYVESPSGEEERERISALAKKYKIDPVLLSQAARKISVLDKRKVSQISAWLEKVAHTFEEISAERGDLMQRLHQISVMSELEA